MTVSAKCSESWGNSGLMLNSQLYRRRPLVETIKEIESGSMAGDRWPTPSANEDAAGTPAGKMQGMLGNNPGVRGRTPEEWKQGSLNPAWVCAHLMNWPAGWDSIEPLPPNSIKEWKEKTLAGTWWSEEPHIPRIGKNIPDRVKRLKVLGNGMVPLCFAVAFEELSR